MPISALEHWSYCARQCALIHVERTFTENLYTLRGRMLHDQVDDPGGQLRGGVRVERALRLWSNRLGLTGKADVVEFEEESPYPIEFKHGPRREWGRDDLQLCAQAICLEEMTGRVVVRGAVYHYRSRRRREVTFSESLRASVETAVVAVRRMLQEARLPPPVNDARCRRCSLRDSCLPSVVDERDRMRVMRSCLFSVRDA